jgi:hypothetical protein
MKKSGVPVKGIRVDAKTGKLIRVHSYDASKQRRIAGSKRIKVGKARP